MCWRNAGRDYARDIPNHGGDLMQPLSFSDEMFDRLIGAAALLPQNARDNFMRSVANRINDLGYEPDRRRPGLSRLALSALGSLSVPRTRRTEGSKCRLSGHHHRYLIHHTASR